MHEPESGLGENAPVARAENLLPIGLAEGCRLKRPVAKDAVLTFDDVEIPAGRLADRLWREQMQRFFPEFISIDQGLAKV